MGVRILKDAAVSSLTDNNKPIEAQLQSLKTSLQNLRQDLKGPEKVH